VIRSKLKQIRDRLVDVFESAIYRLEPEPRKAPDPRDERLEKERKEVKRLLAELRQSHIELKDEIEETDFSPLYQDEDPSQ